MPYKDPEKQKEAMKEIRRRYRMSEKGLENKRKYKNSKAGKESKNKYATERRKLMSAKDRKTLYDRLKYEQKSMCAYCKSEIREGGGQIDRIIPGAAYTEGNCVLSCAECNMQKSNKKIDEFIDILQEQGIIPTKSWTIAGGRYHRIHRKKFKPNPKYRGELSQELPEKE